MTEDVSISLPAVERKVTSLRLDPAVWIPFKRACKKMGDSTCGILEPLMYAITVSVAKGLPVQLGKMTLNVNINRITQRERRRWKRRGDDVEVVKTGSPDRCAFCNNSSQWLVTRWPSSLICQKEYVCGLHKGDLSRMVKTLGVELLSVYSPQTFSTD